MARIITPGEALRRVPQQEPFRFVDEILELEAERAVGVYRWRPEADFYRGHFPGNPVTPGDRARSYFNETSAALVATFGVPGFFTPRFPPAPLWPQGTLQSQSYYDTAPLRKTLERLVASQLRAAA